MVNVKGVCAEVDVIVYDILRLFLFVYYVVQLYLISAIGIHCALYIYFEWVMMDAYGVQFLGQEKSAINFLSW